MKYQYQDVFLCNLNYLWIWINKSCIHWIGWNFLSKTKNNSDEILLCINFTGRGCGSFSGNRSTSLCSNHLVTYVIFKTVSRSVYIYIYRIDGSSFDPLCKGHRWRSFRQKHFHRYRYSITISEIRQLPLFVYFCNVLESSS